MPAGPIDRNVEPVCSKSPTTPVAAHAAPMNTLLSVTVTAVSSRTSHAAAAGDARSAASVAVGCQPDNDDGLVTTTVPVRAAARPPGDTLNASGTAESPPGINPGV